MMMSAKYLSAIFLLAGLLLLAPACSNNNPAATKELCVEFTPAAQASAGAVTSRIDADSECGAVGIEIIATDIDDLFGFYSVVTYDPDVVSFGGYSTVGSVLESGGADVAVVVHELVLGELTIGASRVSDVGVSFDDTQVVIELVFTQFAQQTVSGAISLDEPCLLSSLEPPLPMNAVSCSGGTIAVR
jgi:tRNA threonylcarbamoyladenosine modification (KEOPS) complex  Pcc1 subunit